MTSGPTAVLFDLDGTLCEYERRSDDVLAATFDRLEVDGPFEMAEFHQRYTEFLKEAVDAEDLYEQCFTALARDAGFDAKFGRELATTFLNERDITDVRPCPGAHAAIEALRADHAIGLVTNGHPDLQRRKLRAIDLADAFETEVFAGYDTPAKPSPEPFYRALEALDVDPAEAVYVGNSPSIDVVGARNAGLQAALVTNGSIDELHDPEFELASLRDLEDPPWRSGSTALS